MAARVAGASVVICMGRVASRLEMAMQIGAIHVINSSETDVVDAIRQITSDGVQNALDTRGRADVIQIAVKGLRHIDQAAADSLSGGTIKPILRI